MMITDVEPRNPINPKVVIEYQRQKLIELIEKKVIYGKPEGIGYLTRDEANKIIIEGRKNGAKI